MASRTSRRTWDRPRSKSSKQITTNTKANSSDGRISAPSGRIRSMTRYGTWLADDCACCLIASRRKRAAVAYKHDERRQLSTSRRRLKLCWAVIGSVKPLKGRPMPSSRLGNTRDQKFSSIYAWCHSYIAFENTPKEGGIFVSDFVTDLVNRFAGALQFTFGRFDT